MSHPFSFANQDLESGEEVKSLPKAIGAIEHISQIYCCDGFPIPLNPNIRAALGVSC